MPEVFISYRREDTIAYAGRIYDRLSSQFGSSHVFMDIDTLEPGVDFVELLQQTVVSCDVCLVIIGKNWLTAKDGAGICVSRTTTILWLSKSSPRLGNRMYG